jgi:predicted metalloprotease with PDZ domain
MNKKACLVCVFFLSALVTLSQKNKPFQGYRFSIDLVHIINDRVKVELICPVITQKTITYQFPKIVPGTYSIDDFGRYVEQFKAFDRRGDTLAILKMDQNSWVISQADRLYKITYFVNDTYDDYNTKQTVFEPAGSDIEKDTVFAINNQCMLGYFDGMKNIPYEVNFAHPAGMYGSTALKDLDISPSADRFVTESYNQIVDNPFLYDFPDTTIIKVGKTEVLISVYSPHKIITSKFLAEKLDTLLKAQTKYLGGTLPVDKYAFLIFLNDKPGPSGSEGALEHSYSSFYYFRERGPEKLSQQFVSAAAHEFFHIITPLSIHSQEIQYFDFNHPKMSQHLWLYEGSTEYHAQLVQKKYGIITPQEYLNRLSRSITASKTRFNDTVPFTVMSSGVLGQYKDQFTNVYQKGALIVLCLDIKLLQWSHGKYGFVNLMHDLSLKYGKKKGFRDEELFGEIGKLTYPGIVDFLNTYVAGGKPLPLEEIFNSVGVSLQPVVETKDSSFSLGHVTLGFNPETGRVIVTDVSSANSVGKTLGYQKNDEIISVNGLTIGGANANRLFVNFGSGSKEGDSLIVKVLRKDQAGEYKEWVLSAVMTKFPVIKFNVLDFMDQPTPEQLALRNDWLKPNGIQLN